MTSKTLNYWGYLLTVGLLGVTAAQAQPGFGGFGGGGGGNNTSTRARNTTYPTSTDIGQARITYDPETRSVIVVSDDETAAHIKEVVTQLDRPSPQVLIKVVFLEVTYNKGSDIGVSLNYTKNLGNLFPGTAPSPGGDSSAKTLFDGMTGLSSGAGTINLIAKDLNATLTAIAEAGKVEVLSRPSILARNNQQATITVGQQVPLISGVTYDNFGNQRNAVTYEDVGIILTVTPFITSDGMVEMVLAPEISSLSESSVSLGLSTNGTSVATAPIINIRSADTVVVTPDQQTVVIGGLMSTRKGENVSKIPLLGDIPILGAAFRRKVKTNEKTELMIFLTPTIVPDPRTLAMMTKEERKNSQVPPSAFTDEELNRYLDQKPEPPEEKYKFSEPPPYKKK
jgi:type II secretion system protein D